MLATRPPEEEAPRASPNTMRKTLQVKEVDSDWQREPAGQSEASNIQAKTCKWGILSFVYRELEAASLWDEAPCQQA